MKIKNVDHSKDSVSIALGLSDTASGISKKLFEMLAESFIFGKSQKTSELIEKVLDSFDADELAITYAIYVSTMITDAAQSFALAGGDDHDVSKMH